MHHICLIQLVFLPIVWLVLIAGHESNMPGSSASYFFPIILFFKCLFLLLTVIAWMSSKCFLKPADKREDSPDGKLAPGVLQWYLNFRTGRRQSSPPGVRGTVAKTGKLTLQMKTEKQRHHVQKIGRQRKLSSQDRRGSISSSRSSSSSLTRNETDKELGPPRLERSMKRDNRQHAQHPRAMESSVSNAH